MKSENVLLDKSLSFAARIVRLNKYLVKEKKEHIISKQIIRSATCGNSLLPKRIKNRE